MSTFRTLTAAGVAALALAGGAALTGSTAQAQDGDGHRVPPRPAAKALVFGCSGGETVAMSHKASDFQSVAAGATAQVEGSQWSVQGPNKGSDKVLVTFETFASTGGAGELSTVGLYKNGVLAKEGAKYLTYNGEFDTAAVSFCAKVKQGISTFELRVTDGGGSATALYFPTVTYERFQ